MSLERKGNRHLRKLTDFMYQPADRRRQDGGTMAVSLTRGSTALSASLTAHGTSSPPGLQMQGYSSPLSSPPGTPAAESPAKARIRLDSPCPELHETNQQLVIQGSQSSQTDPIAAYPTMGQPVMDNTLKEILMSLGVCFKQTCSPYFNNLTILSLPLTT